MKIYMGKIQKTDNEFTPYACRYFVRGDKGTYTNVVHISQELYDESETMESFINSLAERNYEKWQPA